MKVVSKYGYGLIIMAILFLGCNKKDNPSSDVLYWQQAFLPGNFSINTTSLSLQKDASATDHTTDFVLKADLPDDTFNLYTIKLYVPNNPEDYKVVADSIFVWLNTGAGKRLIAHSVQQTASTNGETNYSVFEIKANDSMMQGNPATFQTITFLLYCHYDDLSSNKSKGSRNIIADVYKKE